MRPLASISLRVVLRNHEEQLARLSSAEARWSVTYRNPTGGADSVERIRTVIAPEFEASITAASNTTRRKHYWWNGRQFGRTVGIDAENVAASIEASTGQLYHADLPVDRLFKWRTLRAYRLLANEADQSLRQLCKESLEKPVLSTADGLIRIRLAHLRSGEADPGVFAGRVSIVLDIDPAHGYLIRRHTTVLEHEHGKGQLAQTMEAQEFQEFAGNLFLPTHVTYLAATAGGDARQAIAFDYKSVNEPVDTGQVAFVENLLVTEYETYGDGDALGFYVAGADGRLGERFPAEEMAALVRYHRLGGATATGARNPSNCLLVLAAVVGGVTAIGGLWIYKRKGREGCCLLVVGVFIGIAPVCVRFAARESTLESQLRTLESAPAVGTPAPAVRATNLQNGMVEEVVLPGHVTLIEFWSTSCGPCQPAMQKLDDLTRDKASQWGSRVQIITISVDDDHQVARRHLQARGWLFSATNSNTRIWRI